MAKIKINENIDEETGKKYHHTQYLYNCLGCGYEHAFQLKSDGGFHEFNMNLDKPTISPSLLQNFVAGKTCHSFIRNGFIEYLGDCNHNFAGKTIELPDYE